MPLCSKIVGASFAPAPVWKLQSGVAVRRVEGEQSAVAAPDEDDVARRSSSSRRSTTRATSSARRSCPSSRRSAEKVPMFSPKPPAIVSVPPSATCATPPCFVAVARRRGVAGDAALRADVEQVRVRVVARRLPVRAALRPRREDRHRLPVGRVHLRRPDRLHRRALRERRRLPCSTAWYCSSETSCGTTGAYARDRLRRPRLLVALLRHRLLRRREQRLAGLAVQQVEPAGLLGLADPVHVLAVDRRRRRAPSGSARRSPRCRGAPSGSTT